MNTQELEQENNQLLDQLHQIQKKCERYYLRVQELETNQPADSPVVDNELPQAVAEQLHLKQLQLTQEELSQLAAENSLAAKINQLLTQNSGLSLAAKVKRLERTYKLANPPKELGENYSKVIAKYQQGGLPAVKQLLTSYKDFAIICANAYTSLARSLLETDPKNAAQAARLAFQADPRGYRQKWLAFRLNKARKVGEAAALLELLPADTPLSASEKQQIKKIQTAVQAAYLKEAKQLTNYTAKQESFKQQQSNLKIEQEKSRIDEENELLLAQLHQVQEELERYYLQNQKAIQKKEKTQQQNNELAEENNQLIIQLHTIQEELEKQHLNNQHTAEAIIKKEQKLVELENQLIEKSNEITQIKQNTTVQITTLEQEKTELTQKHQEATNLATARQEQITQLEEEKNQQQKEFANKNQQLEEANKQLAQLKQSTAAQISALEQEKTELTQKHQEATNLATARQEQITQLEEERKQQLASQKELAARQELMEEEITRADAQLEIIKELLLKDQLEG